MRFRPRERGIPTAAAAEPLKSRFLDDKEPPTVWPYSEGKVRGISLAPLYRGAPKASLRDSKFYSVLALCDAGPQWQNARTEHRSRNPGKGNQWLIPILPLLQDAAGKLAPFLDSWRELLGA
jgi:hypothetical protein